MIKQYMVVEVVCDRCGRIKTMYSEPFNISRTYYIANEDIKTDGWDVLLGKHLCSECVQEIKEWLGEGKAL